MEQPILVVDDEAGIRHVVEQALKGEGLTVQTARNGQEALTRIQAQRPRLVLLDLQMPVMTGWQLLALLQEAQVELPIVFLTADSRARTEAARCGVAGCLTKPFELDDLFEVIERCSATVVPPTATHAATTFVPKLITTSFALTLLRH